VNSMPNWGGNQGLIGGRSKAVQEPIQGPQETEVLKILKTSGGLRVVAGYHGTRVASGDLIFTTSVTFIVFVQNC
jgi:hypothetical protein